MSYFSYVRLKNLVWAMSTSFLNRNYLKTILRGRRFKSSCFPLAGLDCGVCAGFVDGNSFRHPPPLLNIGISIAALNHILAKIFRLMKHRRMV
jgi:hypothetical protein